MNRDLLASILRVLNWIRWLLVLLMIVDALALIPWFMKGGHA